jgi:hypothetical protein
VCVQVPCVYLLGTASPVIRNRKEGEGKDKGKGREKEGKGKVKVINLISALSVHSETILKYRNKPKKVIIFFRNKYRNRTKTVSVLVCFGSNQKKKSVSKDSLIRRVRNNKGSVWKGLLSDWSGI